MGTPILFKTDVDTERVARAAPRIDALLVWWTDAYHDERRRRPELPLARWGGVAFAALGILLTGFLIATLPDAPCHRGPSIWTLNGLMALFVLFATLFAFLPRVNERIRAWTRRQASRQAAGLSARLLRAAPFTAEYAVEGGRLSVRAGAVRAATDLRAVRRAAFAGDVACLYGGSFPRYVKRLVWLPEGAEREALREALGAAGASVTDLG